MVTTTKLYDFSLSSLDGLIFIACQEITALGGKSSGTKVARKAAKKEDNAFSAPMPQSRVKKGKAGAATVSDQIYRDRPPKPLKVEPLVKEEGEMSDNEEVYEKFKEEKWMEWCQDVMMDQMKTLGRLEKLQTTSADLPKEKVSFFSLCTNFS